MKAKCKLVRGGKGGGYERVESRGKMKGRESGRS